MTIDDIDESVRSKVYTQDYSPKTLIDGVKVIQLKHAVGEDGDFIELMRFTKDGKTELFPGFQLAQINYSTQFPESVKAWHMHLKQDEIWFVPEQSRLLAGLWDLRKDSKTKGVTNRIALGGSSNRALYIPRGVAHGSVNFSKDLGIIMYFTNSHFDKENPDEHRIPWDSLGADFWKPERD